MTAPEEMTAKEHKNAMTDPLEALIPLLAGVTYYDDPSPMCVSEPDGGEPLGDVGRKFAGLVYDLAVAAQRAADDAGSYLKPSEPIQSIGYEVEARMALCVLFARALMEPDLPVTLSGHTALRRIRTEAEEAYKALTDRPLPAPKADLTVA